MKPIIYLILISFASIFFQFIRFKLSRWEKIVEYFESVKRPELKPIYGYWSEFRISTNSYPLGNTFLKLAPTNSGLYLQYDLKFEPIKFYKPVLIPWNNLTITQTKESRRKGGDEYQIQKNGDYLGSIFLQTPISEQIKSKTNELGIQINIV